MFNFEKKKGFNVAVIKGNITFAKTNTVKNRVIAFKKHCTLSEAQL